MLIRIQEGGKIFHHTFEFNWPLMFSGLLLAEGGLAASWAIHKRDDRRFDIVPALAVFTGLWMLSAQAIALASDSFPLYFSWISAAGN